MIRVMEGRVGGKYRERECAREMKSGGHDGVRMRERVREMLQKNSDCCLFLFYSLRASYDS